MGGCGDSCGPAIEKAEENAISGDEKAKCTASKSRYNAITGIKDSECDGGDNDDYKKSEDAASKGIQDNCCAWKKKLASDNKAKADEEVKACCQVTQKPNEECAILTKYIKETEDDKDAGSCNDNTADSNADIIAMQNRVCDIWTADSRDCPDTKEEDCNSGKQRVVV